MTTFQFFPVQRRKTCLDDKFLNNYKISGGVQLIRIEQKYHQHIFCKKNDLNSFRHCSSLSISQNGKKTFPIVGPRGDPMAMLSFCL